MKDKSGSGCVAFAVGGAVLLLLVILGLVFGGVGFMRAKRSEAMGAQAQVAEEMAKVEILRSREMQEVQKDLLTLRMDQLPKYEGYNAGEVLPLEMFVASRLDRGATMLAKEAFLKNSEGSEVHWRLRADNLYRDAQRVVGDFSVPYLLEHHPGSSTEKGSLQIHCVFGEGNDKLREIRRRDWIWVKGELSVNNNSIRINNADWVSEPVEEE